ncbi:chloramphenicol phosphotransferase CPT family protein [Actinocatenispora rupis]|uniref:Chloramphenicol phosphotransferase n=1 Tax=Actinocatenispora rupis TaxID=519421 RepID=A0A8J3IWP5_9ACTN|nr:chloramphenicol phosphotransferase [Actinocatenispora rupis]GID10020.1 chloramphenicol phosphotransferase [Actinocatenispora rupis]
MATVGRVVILNDAPRSGKSSIARAMQDHVPGVWLNLGVDRFKHATPQRFQPGIGLRPGGERPDLEPLVATLWTALYESVAAHARLGVDVVVDAVHHDDYSVPLGILPAAARTLHDLPVLLVGVRCPVDVVRARRRETWGGAGYRREGTVVDPVERWQRAVHTPGRYDLEVDTALLSPDECADRIAHRLRYGPPPAAMRRLAD